MCSNTERKCDPDELKNVIRSSFPSYVYSGPVMSVGDSGPKQFESEADDLDKLLSGKQWEELSPDFIDAYDDEYVLMTDGAVVAFLGAWLCRAIDNLNGENSVRELLLYSIESFSGSLTTTYGLWANQFRLLNQKQRDTIYLIVECFAAMEQSVVLRQSAVRALNNMNEYRRPR